ncbi:hypothetical protein DD238_004513 [Peronospora effusa]|uniref:Uncharacterized protein n=1 Tax=Peronospora effusa TaxID=542832 RepID=A0A3M6VNE9_9STRA|nr:hypothetical protein DD238_004513 [Peronospora effusa]
MMNEMDQEPTSRLRRRSFFEGMESEGALSETISLTENDVANGTSTGGASGDGENYGVTNSLLKPGNKNSPGKLNGVKLSSEDPTVLLRTNTNPTVLKLLQNIWCGVVTWLHVVFFAWTVRFPAAATKMEKWGQEMGNFCKGPTNWFKNWRGDALTSVKYWVYPTQWLTYASISLVLLQMIIYWNFQTLSLDLRVRECVFREKLLASVELMQNPKTISNLHVQSGATALKFLERRFEQQYSPGARRPGEARLPWTCLAVVPMGSDTAMAQARELAFLWPRSQVVAANAYSKITSRVHVAVGASPLDRGMETQIASAGVFAALFPLSAMRPALFAARFPDLVLVETEFALRQMVKFRQERQEERDLRGRTGGDALNTLGGTSPIDLGASDLAASHFGVYLLKTTVPDVYNRHIYKKWDEFLHVVIVDDTDKKKQFTEELLLAWAMHPAWPMLHVRFSRSLALCGTYQRLLSTIIKDHEVDTEAAKDRLEGLDKKTGTSSSNRILNVDLVCEEEANAPPEIVKLKNTIGIHLFPVPPELEKYETTVLESLAVGAVTVTYNTPIMQEWVPDICGLRVGTFDYKGPADDEMQTETDAAAQAIPGGENGYDGRELTDDTSFVKLPSVHVTPSEIEHAIEEVLSLDRVSRVAAGRSGRVHYLRMRTHYMSAVAALDAAICEGDSDDIAETQSEIGQHKRRKVEVETLRAFLY